MLILAKDYNQFMRDIPLNDLMSATDIEGIHVALVNIFSCLKKIRSTKYPAKRAMDFFGVISSDTCSQIIRVNFKKNFFLFFAVLWKTRI